MESWRSEYLTWKGKELNEYQRKLLTEGPKCLSQAWALGAMKRGVDTEVRKRAPLTPDPWDYSGDWNDWAIGLYYESRTNSGDVEERQSD